MPALRRYKIFISHAWRYNDDYASVVTRLNAEPNFRWENRSVPQHDPLLAGKTSELQKLLRDQMRPANAFVILGGMYAANSDWIEFEVEFARRIGRPIIGVYPHGSDRMPLLISNNATEIVGWTAGSIVSSIRRHALADGE